MIEKRRLCRRVDCENGKNKGKERKRDKRKDGAEGEE